MTNYDKKYLKYKTKYIQLKSNIKFIQYGGNKPFIKNYNKINLFVDNEMETFLNPIYGLILCETGFISNIYWLRKARFLETTLSKILEKILRYVPNSIQPTSDVIALEPIDFGRYIAIKYIDYKENIIGKGSNGFSININIGKSNSLLLTTYLNKLKSFNNLLKLHDEIYFHILLYCMWWTLNNDMGCN